MTAPYRADSYQGIIDAFNQVRATQGETKKYYDPNYGGIIEAILDLKKWGQAGDGDIPPGWVPEYDDDGNVIGGEWSPPPDNGTLWFDERQGRLFVWVDDGFYQTNGGDGLPHVGENPPTSQIPGALWFNTSTQVLYIYDGQTWTIISTPQGVTTSSLMLTDPTRSSFSTNRPYLPDTNGLLTQQDYNIWLHSALEKLEDEVDANAGQFQVYMADTPPADAVEGDLWYNTARLQMLIRYDGAWVASAIPLVLDDSFISLSNTVDNNRLVAEAGLQNALAKIHEVSNRPERLYRITYDVAGQSILLSNTKDNDEHKIHFSGSNGVNVDVTGTGIKIDASSLHDDLRALEQSVASGENVAAINDRLGVVEGNVSTLLNATTVSPAAFSQLQNEVAALPTAADVSTRLSLLGGTLQGTLSMGSRRILQVGVPVNNDDAARKIDIDNLKDYADSTYLNKSTGSVAGFSIHKTDTQSPVFDFSSGAYNGQQALKLRTFGGTNNYVTFGTTEMPWEYAWNFGSEEDFCWVHDTNGKQVSIGKDGLTARKLTLGTFLPNTSSGTVVMNKIDVGETLQAIKSALQASSSFEEFKAQVLASI